MDGLDARLPGAILSNDDQKMISDIQIHRSTQSAQESVRMELEASGLKIGDFDYKQRSEKQQEKPFFLQNANNVTFQEIMRQELRTNIPQYDSDTITLKRRTRELTHQQQILDERRRKYQQEYMQLLSRQKQLDAQKSDLKNAKQRFSKFLSENAAKKNNALMKMEQEFLQEEELRGDEMKYKRLQVGLELYIKYLSTVYIPGLEIYEDFLFKVCKINDQFQSPELVQQQFQKVYQAKKQYEEKLLQTQEEQRQQKQVQDEMIQEYEKAIMELRTQQQAVDAQLAQCIDRSDQDDVQLQLKKAQASKQSIVYSNIVSGIDNLYNRALQISKRGNRVRIKPGLEQSMSIEQRCIEKIRIVKHIIQDLNRFKTEVIDKSEFRSQVYSNYNKQRKQRLDASKTENGPANRDTINNVSIKTLSTNTMHQGGTAVSLATK